MRLYIRHVEAASGQCTCFVEYNGIYPGDGIQIITTLEQDTGTWRRSDTSEISQRYADYQGTRTGDN